MDTKLSLSVPGKEPNRHVTAEETGTWITGEETSTLMTPVSLKRRDSAINYKVSLPSNRRNSLTRESVEREAISLLVVRLSSLLNALMSMELAPVAGLLAAISHHQRTLFAERTPPCRAHALSLKSDLLIMTISPSSRTTQS